MLFAIFCTDRPGRLQVRLDNRPAHIEFLKAAGDRLKFGGPTLAEDGETMTGSLIVIDCDDLAAAETWAAGDPFARAGLFESVVIRPWKQVFPQ